MCKIDRRQFARLLGVFVSLAELVIWGVIEVDSLSFSDMNSEVWLTMGIMHILAASGIFAAYKGRSWLILLIFLLSFFPVGLYTLGIPGFARLAGIFDLIFLISGILLLSTRYRIQKKDL